MKLKVNLFGNTFAHHGEPFSSCDGGESQHIDWDKEGSSDVSIHVDDGLFVEGSPTVEKKNRFGWLLEAESITPQFYANAPRVLDRYECIFTSSESLLRLDKRFRGPIPLGMIWIKDPAIREKSKIVSMVASNKAEVAGHVYRLYWVEKLRGKVDFFGRGFQEIENKEEALDDYMFSVAIENNGFGMAAENYFTEKLLDCFATGTIPIYFGCSNIERFFNPEGVIKLDHTFDPAMLTPELYKSKIDAVKENFEKCLQYGVGEDFIYTNHLKEMLT
jgi:hypothetical protein